MRNLRVWEAILIASQTGFVLAAAVTIGLFAGSYLDSVLHTSPVLTVLGAVAGVASGLMSCVQLIRHAFRKNRRSE